MNRPRACFLGMVLSASVLITCPLLQAQTPEKPAAEKPAAEKPVVRTRWMNVLRGNYKLTDTQPSARPADKAKAAQPSRETAAKDLESVDAEKATGSMLGVTVWRMRPAEENDEVKFRVGDSFVTPVQVKSDTPLREGDRVRLTIEVPQSGYLYVIDREQYADGSMGPPTLIFPTRRLLQGDNAVNERALLSIPDVDSAPPFFTLTRRKPNLVAEVILVLVSSEPLPGIGVGRNASLTEVRLREEQVQEWTDKWAGRASRFDLASGEGRPMESEQVLVATRTRALVHEDPNPQTVYWLPEAEPGTPLMISIPLVIGRE